MDTPALPSGQAKLPLTEAAKRLDLSPEAIRKRIQRGKLPAEKGDDGLWYVFVDEDDNSRPDEDANGPDEHETGPDGAPENSPDSHQDRPDTSPDDEPDMRERLIESLQDEVQWLREALRQEREVRVEAERRRDVLFAQFGEQLKQISSTTTTVQEQVEAVAHEVVTPATDGQEQPQPQPSWWRRVFLGER